MQTLCSQHLSCCSASLRHVRPAIRCQQSVGRRTLIGHQVQAAGCWGRHSHSRRSTAVCAEPRKEGTGVERAMEMAEIALLDPEVQKLLQQDMPKDMGSPEMYREMMKDPELIPVVEEQLKSLNANVEKGMYEDVMSRMYGDDVKDRVKDFDFERFYQEVGVTRQKVLDFAKNMTDNPDLAKVVSNPRVMRAIEEIIQIEDPGQMIKYEGDEEVMAALEIVMDLMGVEEEDMDGEEEG